MYPSSAAYQIGNYTDQSGCIPIRIKKRYILLNNSNNSNNNNNNNNNNNVLEGGTSATESSVSSTINNGERKVLVIDYQVLMITTAGGSWVFPKGSIKKNETKKKAAKRETFEESGIKGKIIKRLSPIQVADHAKGCNITYFPLLVTKKLKKQWDEMDKRQRHWVSLLNDIAYLRNDSLKQHIYYALTTVHQSLLTVTSQHINLDQPIDTAHWKSIRDSLEDYLLDKEEREEKKKNKKKKKMKSKQQKECEDQDVKGSKK